MALLDQASGVGGDGFEIASLGLGEDCAESQGGLSGSRHSSEGHDSVAGNIDVHVAEVVLLGSAHLDETTVKVAGVQGRLGGFGPAGDCQFTVHWYDSIGLTDCVAHAAWGAAGGIAGRRS
ncbi:hypothetical protein PJL18_01674 [Paenarthrobacter nicotinovorans]|nr:hypothetical protein [Paenarthrobacter nicotinovorans]